MNVIANSKKAIGFICEQHENKLTYGEREALKALDWSSLVNLSLLNNDCFKKLNRLVKYRNPSIENFIDLRSSNIIRRCLGLNLKEKHFVSQAVELAKRFYESGLRSIQDARYGRTFPMNPELLYYAMFLAKDETVLEIAGASGEHAAMLAYSGARKVYMNDIVPGEIKQFERLRGQLPLLVQKKLEPILGNCLDILQLKPELEGKVGLVICNNLLHFFNDVEQEKFLDSLKKILKPGGRAIFTVNACYQDYHNKSIYECYPENTAWETITCFEQDYEKNGSTPVSVLYNSISLSTPKKVSPDYKQYYLWLKDQATLFQWIEDRSVYKILSPTVARELTQIVSEKIKMIQNISVGALRLVTSTFHMFREESFAAIFKTRGFEVEQTLLLKGNGHLFTNSTPDENVGKIGIVIKAPIS